MRRRTTYGAKRADWRVAVPFPWRNGPGTTSNWRPSRFSVAVDTGQWWYNCPEQVTAFLKLHGRSMLLGIGKSIRQPRGYSYTTGSARPHQYVESAKPILYDLADRQHLDVFTRTFRHIAAFSAGVTNKCGRFYRMKVGDSKVLSRVPMSLAVTDPKTGNRIQHDGYEELEVECENANYREPDNRIFAWDVTIREAAWEEWRKQCTHKPRLVFTIRRKTMEGEYASYMKSGSRLTIPVEAIPLFVKRVDTLIREFWTYVQRHPEQLAERRLVYPQQLDLLLERLVYILEHVPEDALFATPELYKEPRRFTQEYLNVLDVYQKKRLRWPPQWSTKKYDADNDVHKIERRIALEKALRFYFLMLIATGLTLLKTEKIFRLPAQKFHRQIICRLYSTAPLNNPQPTARGPPTKL